MSRSIRLVRSSRKEPYGFDFKTLKLDGKHVACNIQPDSIADQAGLKNGDYILKVNDESVSGLWHDAVLMKMATYSKKLDLLVANDLAVFIKERRSSFMVNELENEEEDEDEEDEFKVFVNNRTNLIGRKIAKKRSKYEDISMNEKLSIAPSSRSYRESVVSSKIKTDTLRSANSSEVLSQISIKKMTSTPKTKSKFLSSPVVFQKETSYNPAVNLSAAKAKLDEYGKKIKLLPNSLSNQKNMYGFNFRTSKEGQHVITNIIPDYPAFEAGIQDGDYILEVNGDIITGLSHNHVIRKIFSNSGHVDLLIVTDLDAYLNVRQAYSQIKEGRMTDQEANRYYIKKAANTNLGLNVITNGVIKSVDPHSPAEKAGLRKGLKIININDISLKDKTDHQIRKLIKDNENYLVIDAIRVYDTININTQLVDDLSEFEFVPPPGETNKNLNHSKLAHKNKHFNTTVGTENSDNMSISRDDHAYTRVDSLNQAPHKSNGVVTQQIYSNEPVRSKDDHQIYSTGSRTYEIPLETDNIIGSRVISLIPRPDYNGFGFRLTYENQSNGPAVIRDVKTNSPAYMAGLRENDFVLKVNDKDVVNENYANIVNMLREAMDVGPVKLEVVNKSIYKSAAARPTSIPDEKPFSPSTQLRPKSDNHFKRCFLKLLPSYNGFGLTVSPNLKPKFSIYEVELNSPAYKASLRKNDVIIEIDGFNIRQCKFDEFFNRMQMGAAKQQIEILAISQNGYSYYKDKNKKFSSRNLVTDDNTDIYET